METRSLAFVVAVVALLAGLLASATAATFLLAMSPNSSADQSRLLSRLLVGTLVIGGASAAGAVALMIAGRPWAAAVVGALPTAAAAAGLIWAVLVGSR